MFFRGAGNTLRQTFWNGAWHDNVDLGTPPTQTLTSPPVASASDRLGSPDIIVTARGSNGEVWGRRFFSAVGSWDPWVSYGSPTAGGIDGSPVPFHKPSTGGFYILARGADGYLYARDQVNGWFSLNVKTTGQASIARCEAAHDSDPANAVGVFVRDADGSLKWTSFQTSGYFAWSSLGGFLTASPSAAIAGVNASTRAANVFVRDGNGALQRRRWSGACQNFVPGTASWSNYALLGGYFDGNPAAAGSSPNRFDAVVRGGSDIVHDWISTYVGYTTLGGPIVASPSVVSWGPSRVDVFAQDLNSQLIHRAWSGNGTNTWEPLNFVWEAHGGVIQ